MKFNFGCIGLTGFLTPTLVYVKTVPQTCDLGDRLFNRGNAGVEAMGLRIRELDDENSVTQSVRLANENSALGFIRLRLSSVEEDGPWDGSHPSPKFDVCSPLLTIDTLAVLVLDQ
ncbi:hypothetical protein IF2G_06170 [Cordyceps javanica]|nr:hypothetical protein IF2G_06170 [Cordyceps javanica]